MRRLGIALLGLLVVACGGGAPETLPEAEKAVEGRQWDKAERLFHRAGAQFLTESEKRRVREGMALVAAGKLGPKLRAAEAQPGWKGYEALAELRRWYGRTGGTRGDAADKRVVAAMVARATTLWPEVEGFRSRKHFVGADAKAADILAPLPDGAAKDLRARREALRGEAQAFHAKRATADQPDGARALHAGLVKRFGGSLDSPLAALRAEATVGVTLAGTGGGPCAEISKALGAAAVRAGRKPAQVRFTLTTCQSDQKVSHREERYSYTVKIPYQVTKRVRTGSERYVVQRKTCTTKMPGAYMKEGRVVKTMTTSTYDCSVMGSRDVYQDRVVTKYREEDRQGTRRVRTERNSVRYAGSVQVTWEGGRATFSVGDSATATDTAYSTPQGSKSIDARNTLPALIRGVRGTVTSQIAEGARRRVLASDAAKWLAKADAAFAAGRYAEAEDADVRAVLRGPVPAATNGRMAQRYGLPAGDISGALAGSAYAPKTADWRRRSGDSLRVGRTASYEAGEQLLERGWAWGAVEIGLRTFGATDLPFQPDRHSASFYFRLAYPFLGHIANESGEGWTLYDTGMFDFWLGGRTSEATPYSGGGDESVLAGGIGIGYQLMVGHRSKHFGLFGGLRTQNTFRSAGDLRTAGATHPWVGRMELKFSERHPVFIEAYGFPPFGKGEIWGGDINITTGLSSALVVRAERLKVDALFGGLNPKDDVELGRFATWTLDLNYAFQF